MEGIIKEEDPQRVVLNVGVGTVTLPRDSIEKIERSPLQEQKKIESQWYERYCTHVEYAPSRLRDLSRRFNELERLRNRALRAKTSRNLAGEKTGEKEKEMKNLYQQYLAVNEKLRSADPQADVKAYNDLVAEYKIIETRLKLYEQEKLPESEEDRAPEEISVYRSALTSFMGILTSRQKAMGEDMSEKERIFFEQIGKLTGKMEADFDARTIPLIRKGNNFLARVVLEGKVPARLLVDTGASVVLISENIARQLNIARDKNSFFWMTLANGEKVKAFPIQLATVEMGGVAAENVQAAVLEKSFPGMEDGLLGMSFLGRFSVKIDSLSPSLILEDFTP